MTLRIEPATGAALERALPALAKLRIEVFREWPYLYEGSLDYEANYIERFARLARGVIVVATDAGEAVGAATAAPLDGQNLDVTQPFVDGGYDLGKLFYFGESVLKRAYRGRGIGHAFFDRREAVARSAPGVDSRPSRASYARRTIRAAS
jgi:GNAT superfamily N-acetyltransferase